MISNREALIEHLAQGNPVKYLHFWGHTQKTDKVDKSCFSQWFPAQFVVDGDTYLTAEHYMMAQKARLFEASPRDRIWGIGMGTSHPDACNPANWRGKNLLGFALMMAREQIRKK